MSGKQHVDFHRKVLMRQHLLRHWGIDGAAYVPFIGDGDLAAELYDDRFVYGADLDPDRVEVAASRLGAGDRPPRAVVIAADCDTFPFIPPHHMRPVVVADFDADAEPYAAFRSFWHQAPRADRLVLFFTDGQRQSMMRVGTWIGPDGEQHRSDDLRARQRLFGSYLSKNIWPWFEDFVAPWRVVDRFRYLRGWMVYWGAVIER